MSLGDPTTYGNMLPPTEAMDAVNEAFSKKSAHGYVPACGKHSALSFSKLVLTMSRSLYLFQEQMKLEQLSLNYGLEMVFVWIPE